VKSTDVYAILRKELAPHFNAMGFKRGRALLSWARERSGLFTVFWCQVSQDGWDEFAGSKFTVELQRSEQGEPGKPSALRSRMARLLSPQGREDIRRIQNAVIANLRQPPSTHPALHVSPQVTAWYRSRFVPESVPYTSQTDIWLRYASPVHVAKWARFLATHAAILVQAIEREA